MYINLYEHIKLYTKYVHICSYILLSFVKLLMIQKKKIGKDNFCIVSFTKS